MRYLFLLLALPSVLLAQETTEAQTEATARVSRPRVNQVALVGNLVADIRVGTSQYGPWALGRLAVNNYAGRNADGTPKTRPMFIGFAAYGELATTMAEWKKGDRIRIQGRLDWVDAAGRAFTGRDGTARQGDSHRIRAYEAEFIRHPRAAGPPTGDTEEAVQTAPARGRR